MKNKVVIFILNLRRRDSVRNKELRKVDALSAPDRVKQLKMNIVFKIKKQTCPPYMLSNFDRLNANSNRMTTRALVTKLFVPRVHGQGAQAFFFTAIKEWNFLSNDLNHINEEYSFKNKLKKELFDIAKKREADDFIRSL